MLNFLKKNNSLLFYKEKLKKRSLLKKNFFDFYLKNSVRFLARRERKIFNFKYKKVLNFFLKKKFKLKFFFKKKKTFIRNRNFFFKIAKLNNQLYFLNKNKRIFDFYLKNSQKTFFLFRRICKLKSDEKRIYFLRKKYNIINIRRKFKVGNKIYKKFYKKKKSKYFFKKNIYLGRKRYNKFLKSKKKIKFIFFKKNVKNNLFLKNINLIFKNKKNFYILRNKLRFFYQKRAKEKNKLYFLFKKRLIKKGKSLKWIKFKNKFIKKFQLRKSSLINNTKKNFILKKKMKLFFFKIKKSKFIKFFFNISKFHFWYNIYSFIKPTRKIQFRIKRILLSKKDFLYKHKLNKTNFLKGVKRLRRLFKIVYPSIFRRLPLSSILLFVPRLYTLSIADQVSLQFPNEDLRFFNRIKRRKMYRKFFSYKKNLYNVSEKNKKYRALYKYKTLLQQQKERGYFISFLKLRRFNNVSLLKKIEYKSLSRIFYKFKKFQDNLVNFGRYRYSKNYMLLMKEYLNRFCGFIVGKRYFSKLRIYPLIKKWEFYDVYFKHRKNIKISFYFKFRFLAYGILLFNSKQYRRNTYQFLIRRCHLSKSHYHSFNIPTPKTNPFYYYFDFLVKRFIRKGFKKKAINLILKSVLYLKQYFNKIYLNRNIKKYSLFPRENYNPFKKFRPLFLFYKIFYLFNIPVELQPFIRSGRLEYVPYPVTHVKKENSLLSFLLKGKKMNSRYFFLGKEIISFIGSENTMPSLELVSFYEELEFNLPNFRFIYKRFRA